jgi:O-antigen/teichoic acid export membrane protein
VQALLLLAFPVAVTTTLFATDVVRVFVGEREASAFVGASDAALMILIWFLPLSYVNGVTQFALVALDRQGWITRAFALTVAFNLAGNLALIPIGGIYAASAMTVLSEIVLLAATVPILRREGALLPLARLAWRPAVAALLMGIAVLVLRVVDVRLAVVVAVPAYLALLRALGGLGPVEIGLLRRAISPLS